MTIVLAPSTAANDAAKAAELKKMFEEGVAASRAGNHDAAIEKFNAALAIVAELLRLPLQHRRRATWPKKDEKAGRRGVEEGARDEARLRRGAERAGDALQQPEAVRRSGGDERQGRGGRRRRAAAPTRSFNQGIILWNQGKIAEAKVKFEETHQGQPEPRRRALSSSAWRCSTKASCRKRSREFEKLREARARRPVRDAGEGDDRAVEEVTALDSA